MKKAFLFICSLISLSLNAQQKQLDTLDTKVKDLLNRGFRQVIFKNETADIPALTKMVALKYGELGEEVIWDLSALYYYLDYNKTGSLFSLKEWVILKVKIQDKYPGAINAFTSNNDAWFLFEKTSNKKYLKEALKWSKKATGLEPQSGNWKDTYANLLYKMGRKNEALQWQEKAVQQDPGNDSIRKNLEKMKAGSPTWPSLN